jgi:hypothetical protein
MGHLSVPLGFGAFSAPKFAVNALDRNAAGGFLFGHEMIAE